MKLARQDGDIYMYIGSWLLFVAGKKRENKIRYREFFALIISQLLLLFCYKLQILIQIKAK